MALDLTIDSFLNNSDFNFAKDDEQEEANKKAILENKIQIVVLNKKLYKGDKVKGVVKIYVNHELPIGHVELKSDSVLKLTIRDTIGPRTVDDIVDNYKQGLQPVKKRKPFFFNFIQKYLKKMKKKGNEKKALFKDDGRWEVTSKRAPETQKLRRRSLTAKSYKAKSRVSRQSSFSHRIFESRKGPRTVADYAKSRLRLESAMRRSRRGSKMPPKTNNQTHKKNLSRMASSAFKLPKKYPKMIEKEFVLNTEVMNLFSLRSAIKHRTLLLIPFEVQLPENFPVSYDHDLILSQFVRMDQEREAMISDARSHDALSIVLGKIKKLKSGFEKVRIEHKLMVYFVSQGEKRGIGPVDLFKLSTEQISNSVAFEVFSRMKNQDFKKWSIKAPLYPCKKKKFVAAAACCRPGKKGKFEFQICLDRLSFRNIDNSINMVIKYPNKLLNIYDYLDVVLVVRSTIKKKTCQSMALKKASPSKRCQTTFFGTPSTRFDVENSVISPLRPKPRKNMVFGKLSSAWPNSSRMAQTSQNKVHTFLRHQRTINPRGNDDALEAHRDLEFSSILAKDEHSEAKRGISEWILEKDEEEVPPPPRFLPKEDPVGKKLIKAQLRGRGDAGERGNARKKSQYLSFLISSKDELIATSNDFMSKNSERIGQHSDDEGHPSDRPLRKQSADFHTDELSTEQILYATSLDLLGKRRIHDKLANPGDRSTTELVHRIKLCDIKTKLETVESEYISTEYSLRFYASIGPLSFTQRITKVPLKFISVPESSILSKRELNKLLKKIEDQLHKTDIGYMLPYARVDVGKSQVCELKGR